MNMCTVPPRVPDWAARLGALATQRLGRPFAWGSNDCAAWVADAVAAMHGRDTLGALRGARCSHRQAQRQIRRLGGLPAALEQAGLLPIAPALAQRGDVVMLPGQGGQVVLAVCMGPDALAPGPHGLALAAMCSAVAAWRV